MLRFPRRKTGPTPAAVLLFMLCLGIGTACSAGERGSSVFDHDEAAEVEPETIPENPEAQAQWIDDKIESLKLRERVSQLMLVTLQGGPAPDSSDRQLFNEYPPGGVIISEVLRPETAAAYITDLRRRPWAIRTGIPLFIGTDLYNLPREVRRKAQPFVPLPSMLAIAASDEPEATQGLARLIADHLEKMGFNLHLGPSLELAPALPDVMGSIHCFGSDPEFVATCGQAFVETFADNGILAMPMGFPGGGANRIGDSPAVLVTPITVLAEQDLLPFSRAIEHGAPIIHVGNTLVPTLGHPGEIASVCPAVIDGLLRQGLEFDGVIVVGPMDDPDVKRLHDPSDAAILALKAGADMIYWNEAGQRVMKTVDEVVEAVANGTLTEDMIDNALRCVLHVKIAYNLATRKLPEPDAAKKLSKDQTIPQDSYRIERQSITLLLNRENVLPLDKESLPIGVTGVAGVEPLHDALEEYLKRVGMQFILTAKHGNELYDFEIRRVIARAPGLRTVVCVLSAGLGRQGPISLIRQLKAEVQQVVVVLVGYPDHIEDYLEADAIVLAYADPAACEHSMRAVADVLVGRGPVRIRPTSGDIVTRVGQPEAFSVLDTVLCPAGRLPVTLDEPFVAGYAVHYDPSDTIKKGVWDFGDGQRSKDFLVEKLFDAPGRFPVTLTITDKENHVVTRTFNVVVE